MSVLGPTLVHHLTIWVLVLQVLVLHFYADDSVIYCCTKSVASVFEHFQSVFGSFQSQLLQRAANECKNKVPSFLPSITTTWGVHFIDFETSYKYFVIPIDENVTFKAHIENLFKNFSLN